MSSNNGPSGRSPYQPPASRGSNRRRLSAEMPSIDDSSNSPLFMNGHGLLRLSPSSAAHWSPAMGGHNNNNPSARRQRRFFDNVASNNNNSNNDRSAATHQQGQQKKEDKKGEKNSGNKGEEPLGENSNNTDAGDEEIMDGIQISKLRALTKEALGTPSSSSLPSTAVFYAGLLYAKTQSQDDSFLYAQALARNGEAKRCVRLLEQSGILDLYNTTPSLRLESVLLAAEAMSTLSEWQSVLDLLEDASQLVTNGDQADNHYGPQNFSLEDNDEMAWETFLQTVETPANYIHPVSRLCLWRGRAYSETGHPQRAALYWKRAIRMDYKCVQALDFLLSRSAITPQEAYEVVAGLDFEPQMEWLKHLYLARIELSPQDVQDESVVEMDPRDLSHNSTQMDINMHMPSGSPFSFQAHPQYLDASSIQISSPSMLQTPNNNEKMHFATRNLGGNTVNKEVNAESKDQKLPSAKSDIQVNVDEAFSKLWNVHKLYQSPEVLAMAARRAYRRYDLKGALEHCHQLAAIDPLCQTAGYVYVSTLAALGHKRHLFRLAHEWVEASPKSARAWFAVGSYYYACERYHVAQRHFCRATRLDPHCTEAWIAFGCSFAACDESDQALASFRAAQRLSPGEYASLLYMGMEYLRTNHLVLAQYFLSSALKASGGDPLCLNELGVLSIQRGDYDGAIGWFVRAIRACVQSEVNGDERKTIEECIELCQEKHWEPTIFNLGQCCRKTRKFKEAVRCFERCVALSPVSVAGCILHRLLVSFLCSIVNLSVFWTNSYLFHRRNVLGIQPWPLPSISWVTWTMPLICIIRRLAVRPMTPLVLRC